jgi:hypothetical protein
MHPFHYLESLVLRAYVRARGAVADRGDVPGWVLITVMTAALVSALLITAEPLLQRIFKNAVNSVHN